MANLRRHFNFNAKTSLAQEPFNVSSCKASFNNLDKQTLMNDICNCLDLCCSYIQALNSLCTAGSSLARSLFNTVREVPTYQNISLQFLTVWEEVSKATAGASAAVKTETLMLLQEVLNSLEMSTYETNMNEAIGSCLCSFVELQAQFSWSTWKSLSKLSKNFNNESLKHSLGLQWKSLDKNHPSKIYVNADLNSAIKKHYSQLFCKVGIPKINESHRPSDRQFHPSPVPNKTNYQFSPEKNTHTSSTDSLWSASSVWSSKNCSGMPGETDLEEVINLLSCVPVQQFTTKLRNKNLISYPVSSEQIIHMNPKDPLTSLSGPLQNQHTWPKSDDKVKADSLFWSLNDSSSSLSLNSSVKRPHTYDSVEFYKRWECQEIQMWNASSTETGSSSDDVSSHCLDNELFPIDKDKSFNNVVGSSSKRGCSNRESMPGGLENVSEYGEHFLEMQSKINTWPLKQPLNPGF